MGKGNGLREGWVMRNVEGWHLMDCQGEIVGNDDDGKGNPSQYIDEDRLPGKSLEKVMWKLRTKRIRSSLIGICKSLKAKIK